jgi:hypothetical protein
MPPVKNADVHRARHTAAATALRLGCWELIQASGGARGISGSARSASRKAAGGTAGKGPAEGSDGRNVACGAAEAPRWRKLAPSSTRVTPTAPDPCPAGEESWSGARPVSADPCDPAGPTGIPARQWAVAIAITSRRTRQRLGITSSIPAARPSLFRAARHASPNFLILRYNVASPIPSFRAA